MSQLKPVSEAKTKSVFNVYAHEGMDLSSDPQVIALNARPRVIHPRPMLPSRIAIVGNYLPRQLRNRHVYNGLV